MLIEMLRFASRSSVSCVLSFTKSSAICTFATLSRVDLETLLPPQMTLERPHAHDHIEMSM